MSDLVTTWMYGNCPLNAISSLVGR